MLKFIKGHMASMDSIEIFPLISLALFFHFFLGWTIYALREKKDHVKHMSNLPLDLNESKPTSHE